MKFSQLLICLVLLCPTLAQAASILIDPILIDVEVEARDIIKKDITLINKTEQKLVLFTTVNEVSVGDSGEIKEFVSPVMTDRTDTVTSWLEITRGRIELMPGEEKIIPLTIRIHPYAQAGTYHAFVGFVPDSKRHLAEAKALAGNADGVIVKLDLVEKKNELLHITAFTSKRIIFNPQTSTMSLEVTNQGDTTMTPAGGIIFYNSRGEEVAASDITEKTSIAPGSAHTFNLPIPISDKIGRFKANATLRYGDDGGVVIFDTTQFFLVTPYFLAGFFLLMLFLSGLITYALRSLLRSGEDEEENLIPLKVRNDRIHNEKDHDIIIKK